MRRWLCRKKNGERAEVEAKIEVRVGSLRAPIRASCFQLRQPEDEVLSLTTKRHTETGRGFTKKS